ncbi:MAG: hypothetical protein Q4D04_05365 [Clostridia bacterium]|nr:hypothetical protein [Clostridia bacterium]
MLKLVKYEFRRNLPGIIAIGLCVIAMQTYYLISINNKSPEHTITAAMLLFMATMMAVGVIFIYSISLYSRELASKSSYLTFMTPNSSTKILGAKLLSTLLLGMVIAVTLGAFAVWDITLLSRVFPEIDLYRMLAEQFLRQTEFSLASIGFAIGIIAIEFLIEFFTTVVLAYLAITLSSTVFQNRKFKGIISAIIFIGLMVLVFYLNSLVSPSFVIVSTMEMFVALGPIFAIDLVFMIAAFMGSAWLLKYKVSL